MHVKISGGLLQFRFFHHRITCYRDPCDLNKACFTITSFFAAAMAHVPVGIINPSSYLTVYYVVILSALGEESQHSQPTLSPSS